MFYVQFQQELMIHLILLNILIDIWIKYILPIFDIQSMLFII